MNFELVDMKLVSRDNDVRAFVSIEMDGILMSGIEVRELSLAEKRLLITYPLEISTNRCVKRVAFYPMTAEKKKQLESFITEKYFELNC